MIDLVARGTVHLRLPMTLRCHVDPVLFTRLVMFDEQDLRPEDVELWRNPTSSNALTASFFEIFNRHPRAVFRNAYHCFQGLAAPFLRHFAQIAWHEISKSFEMLSGTATDHRDWVGAAIRELHVLSLPQTFIFPGNGVSPAQRVLISTLEIIEGITSVVEWQIQARRCGYNVSDLEKFDLWQKRTPLHLKLFHVVSDSIGPTKALCTTADLGTAALFTNWPTQALGYLLAELAARASKSDSDAIDPRTRSGTIFRLLESLPFEAPTNASGHLWDRRLFRLALPFGPETPSRHPHLKEEYKRDSRNEELSFWSLTHPELATAPYKAEEEEVEHPTTIIKVRFNDGVYRVHRYVSGRYLREGQDDGDTLERLHFKLRSCAMVYDVMRRAVGVLYDPGVRTCELRACPEWEANFCGYYTPPSSDHAECCFLSELTNIRQGLRMENKQRDLEQHLRNENTK